MEAERSSVHPAAPEARKNPIPVARDHRFRWIAIADSGDPDHSGCDDGAASPLTIFNRG
jgi:hypothetical protein